MNIQYIKPADWIIGELCYKSGIIVCSESEACHEFSLWESLKYFPREMGNVFQYSPWEFSITFAKVLVSQALDDSLIVRF